jgi:hypothetical protein
MMGVPCMMRKEDDDDERRAWNADRWKRYKAGHFTYVGPAPPPDTETDTDTSPSPPARLRSK